MYTHIHSEYLLHFTIRLYWKIMKSSLYCEIFMLFASLPKLRPAILCEFLTLMLKLSTAIIKITIMYTNYCKFWNKITEDFNLKRIFWKQSLCYPLNDNTLAIICMCLLFWKEFIACWLNFLNGPVIFPTQTLWTCYPFFL